MTMQCKRQRFDVWREEIQSDTMNPVGSKSLSTGFYN